MTNPSEDKQGGINYALIHDEAVALLPLACNSEQFLTYLKSAMQKVALDAARSSCAALIKEAADSIHASTAEEGISDDRRQYRIGLEARLRACLKGAPVPESEATVAFHKLLQDEGEEYEGPDAPAAPTPPYSATMTEESLDRWLGRFCNQAVDGSVRVEQAKSLLRELLGSSLSATEASKP